MRRRQELHPRTAAINKTQKNHSKKSRLEALQWLAATFPKAFDTTRSIHPLKIGILEDILVHAEAAAALGISRSKIREALAFFIRGVAYKTCVKQGGMRIDLDGNPTTAVTKQEAENAANIIKKQVDKSLRHTRKTLGHKTVTNYGVRPQGSKSSPSQPPIHAYASSDPSPQYIERTPLYNPSNTNNNTNKAATVIITHKSTRQYDPQAVARLKEKLGLSQAEGSKKDSESSE